MRFKTQNINVLYVYAKASEAKLYVHKHPCAVFNSYPSENVFADTSDSQQISIYYEW